MSMNIKEYQKLSTRKERETFLSNLTLALKNDVGFRFLKQEGDKYVEISSDKSRAKIGHALRDLSNSLRAEQEAKSADCEKVKQEETQVNKVSDTDTTSVSVSSSSVLDLRGSGKEAQRLVSLWESTKKVAGEQKLSTKANCSFLHEDEEMMKGSSDGLDHDFHDDIEMISLCSNDDGATKTPEIVDQVLSNNAIAYLENESENDFKIAPLESIPSPFSEEEDGLLIGNDDIESLCSSMSCCFSEDETVPTTSPAATSPVPIVTPGSVFGKQVHVLSSDLLTPPFVPEVVKSTDPVTETSEKAPKKSRSKKARRKARSFAQKTLGY